jgi:NADP-dependent 3-hydroxy acid dehydrogenase YdfG
VTALAKTGARWRTALVTGASSGIGAALARRLAQDGVQVVLAARRVDKLEALVRELGGGARALELDVTQPDECVARIRQVDDEIGGLDLVVANAGLGAPQAARKLDWEKVRPVVLTNFVGAMATLTAVLPRMVERKRGHLVGVSSVAVYAPTPGGSAYRGTKTGLSAFLDNLRAELGGTGVDVSAVHPGFVRTPMADNFTAQPPVILEADVAADLIVRRLRRAPARIDFPSSVVLMMRFIGWLPTFVSDRLVRAVELGPSS